MPRATHDRYAARTPLQLRIADCGSRIEETRLATIRNPRSAIRIQPHRGFTLIEMLMATAITLLMMAAIVNLFATLSSSISDRRAVIELNGQLRQVRQRLALDLAGCTVPSGDQGLMPWRQRPGAAVGYLEIVEGFHGDHSPSSLLADGDGDGYPDGIDVTTSIIPSSQAIDPDSDWVTDARALGDYDDVLALTVRSLDEPFVADVPGAGRVESNLAEVIWYASENPADGSQGEPGMRKIYRRVYLIAPWLGQLNGGAAIVVSSHQDPSTGNRIANTLADLTRREYRALHDFDHTLPANAYNFPHVFQHPGASDQSLIVLDDALAFDVRVFDPGAPAINVKGVVVEPTDPGWGANINNLTANPIVGFGCYVDLGWDNSSGGASSPPNYFPPAGAPPTSFQIEHRVGWHPAFGADPTQSTPNPSPANPFRGGTSVYDTWTWHYENDGVDQYNDGVIDLGRNGVDDAFAATGYYVNGMAYANGVDDIGERETSPPYPVPLRGVKVILRTYERDARQIREVSVTNSFVP